MFGLFKKKRGKEDFSKDIDQQYFEKLIKGVNNPIAPITMIKMNTLAKEILSKKKEYSSKYSITEKEVENIVKEISKNIHHKYFEYRI